ncbi:MAG: efflux RND transporter periplasmic adaptor subunit [Terriglobales bacterium]
MKWSSRRAIHQGTACFLGMALSLTWAGCNQDKKEEKPVVAVKAATVRKTDISRIVKAEAVVFPLAQSAITPKISAPVKQFYVTRGQKVRQGQLLATLENRDLSAAAQDNTGAFEQAQAAYATSIGGTLPEENQKAELDVRTHQQELEAQQKLYSSREELYKQGALPRKDLDQAAVALVQAKSQYEMAKKHLDALNAGGKQQALKSAKGQLTSAEGKLLNSKAQLSYSEIRSPINGVVTDRPFYPGEMASASTPLLTVMDISQVIAKAHIPQTDAVLLHKGDKAVLEVAGWDKKIDGAITLVSPALDPSSTTVEIWVQAPNRAGELRPGTTVQLSITAQTVHDALVVPSESVLNADKNAAQVMVIDGQSEAHSREVKTGIQTAEEVQIVSGLQAGEQVVSQGAYGLPDKTKVKVEKGEAASPSKDKDEGDVATKANGKGGGEK